jgi:hypothetical protein
LYRRGLPDDFETRKGSHKLNQFLASLSCVFNDKYVHASGFLLAFSNNAFNLTPW